MTETMRERERGAKLKHSIKSAQKTLTIETATVLIDDLLIDQKNIQNNVLWSLLETNPKLSVCSFQTILCLRGKWEMASVQLTVVVF